MQSKIRFLFTYGFHNLILAQNRMLIMSYYIAYHIAQEHVRNRPNGVISMHHTGHFFQMVHIWAQSSLSRFRLKFFFLCHLRLEPLQKLRTHLACLRQISEFGEINLLSDM
jgi:hypothetical protein